MNTRNSSKLLGLSDSEQHLLRGLYEACLADRPMPASLRAPEHADSWGQLVSAGLISEDLRLTLQGLVIAVNLPKRCHRSLCVAA